MSLIPIIPNRFEKMPHLYRYLDAIHLDTYNLSSIDGRGTIEQFENEFAKFVGAKYSVAVNSCTAALQSSLLACDIGPGDEVIVSPYGWGQTVAAILSIGATPVFADIDPQTYNLNPYNVGSRISQKTAAILVTHFLGHPAQIDKLQEIASDHHIWLIADAAQALGSMFHDKPLGAFADISAYSFGRGKALYTGEGGMIVTSNIYLYEGMIAISQHSIRALRQIEDWSLRKGVEDLNLSYRMHPFAAALGLDQIKNVPQIVNDRRQRCLSMNEIIKKMHGIDPPFEQEKCMHSYHAYSPTCHNIKIRADLINNLLDIGINATLGPVGIPIHLRGFFQQQDAWYPKLYSCIKPHPSWRSGSCPLAEARCSTQEIIIY